MNDIVNELGELFEQADDIMLDLKVLDMETKEKLELFNEVINKNRYKL
jgi:hypothetical protein